MLDFSIKTEFLVLAPIIIYRNRAAICVCIECDFGDWLYFQIF